MERRMLGSLFLAVVVILLALAVNATPGQGKKNTEQAFERILAKPRAAASRANVRALHGSERAQVVREYPKIGNLQVIKLPKGANLQNVLARYKKSGLFEYVEPDAVYTAYDIPTDPLFSDQWGMHNVGQAGGTADCDIDAAEAWDTQSTASDVIVAVIDTGVQDNHEDLAANMWVNPGEIAGNGIDDDNNGYIDDIHGICSIDKYEDPDGYPWPKGVSRDDHYHGTHCAGIIGAAYNGVGVVGVCRSIKIMSCKFLNWGGSGYASDAIECINYAVSEGADVLSNSWGGGVYTHALKDAIEMAADNGVIFVAAAGNRWDLDNDLVPAYPCGYDVDNVIAVSATDRNDALASWSHYGLTTVDLAAPGVDIMSSLFDADNPSSTNTYGLLSGTSMACPHVSGAVALLKSASISQPYQRLIATILGSVDQIPSMAGKCTTGGRLNINNALAYSPQGVFMNAHPNRTFYAMSGTGPFAPGSYTYSLVNVSMAPLQWQATNTQSWLTIYPSSGTMNPFQTTDVTVSINSNAATLPWGAYTDTITFTNSSGIGNTTRTITLRIGGPIRVKTDGDDTNDGSSWTLAKKTINAAMEAAFRSNEIWVAGGTYNEDHIVMRQGVGLYGGFAGNETSRDQRDFAANETTIQGDGGWILAVDPGAQLDTVIDGFTITGAYGSNDAGAINCHGSATISHNIIKGNHCNYVGGGIMVYDGDPLITNNMISDNLCYEGSAVAVSGISNAVVTHNTMVDNTATYYGAVRSYSRGNPVFANNIIAFNNKGISVTDGNSVTLINNDVYGNTDYNYLGTDPGATDFSLDPLFVNYSNGDYSLSLGSPCIDAADEEYAPGDDVHGQVRPNGEGSDVGADEVYQTAAPVFSPDGGHFTSSPTVTISCATQDAEIRYTTDGAEPTSSSALVTGPISVSQNVVLKAKAFKADMIASETASADFVMLAAGSVVFVDTASGSDSNNGLSWAAAKQTIQAGLYAASAGGEVWVASGTYSERIGLVSGVALYGGFDGTEIRRESRLPLTNTATISGSSYVVNIPAGCAETTAIDGFTITGGNYYIAGGILCSGPATIANNIIRDNQAVYTGAGIGILGCSPKIINNWIHSNSCFDGAGIHCSSGSPIIVNNTIVDNTSTMRATVYFGANAAPTLVNNIIAFNTRGIQADAGAVVTINNNDVYSNASYDYLGLSAGTGDISLDPLFANRTGYNYHLISGSPCIDAGDAGALQLPSKDIDMQFRDLNAIDMGADEYVQ